MRYSSAIWGVLAGALALAGCSRAGPGAAGTDAELAGPSSVEPPRARERPPHLNHAQAKLPTIKLWLGNQELDAEVARTAMELQTGMMFRTNLAENEAMLFVFPRPHRASFYMRNTTLALTGAYIDPEGTVLELHEFKPLNETPVDAATDRVQYVLETRVGWFQRHQLGVGVVVRTPYGALHELNWSSLRPRRAR
jgi:hypothetical protein